MSMLRHTDSRCKIASTYVFLDVEQCTVTVSRWVHKHLVPSVLYIQTLWPLGLPDALPL